MQKRSLTFGANHKEAATQGYLENGTSSAIGFPTGAGKSTTAQLKIHAVLLSGRKAVFLAPTHALIDQTVRDLRKAIPRASVQGERGDEFGFSGNEEDLSDVLVMTPEACLLLCHMEPDRFDDVGLLIFDECHLIHPKTDGDRRAIDAMLCILGFVRVAPEADIVLLSAMMKNTKEMSDWLTVLTGRKAVALDNAWKPTRQLRGCIVYDIERLRALETKLRAARSTKSTGRRISSCKTPDDSPSQRLFQCEANLGFATARRLCTRALFRRRFSRWQSMTNGL